MSKFTPGPWEIKAFLGRDKDWGIYKQGHDNVLAEAHEEFEAKGVRKPEEAKANAYLIAAAPDLFEVCNAAFDWWRDNGTTATEPEWVELLCKATQKAEGIEL